jgi:hypothetical protein
LSTEGIYCLANDGIIDGLIALCESVRRHSPHLPVTVIPFDSQLDQVRAVLARYGYALMDDPSLRAMDQLGERYWPGERRRPHTMRKFCAFWGTYDRFMFLDADVVALCDLTPYFKALGGYDFMYFATDIENVYRPGSVRDAMIFRYQTAGFNSGVYIGRSGLLSPDRLEDLRAQAQRLRHGFVDNLEQTFINYVVDVSGWSKIHAHEALPDLVDAGAAMRLRRSGGGYVLDDPRVQASGRPVTLIHWAGHNIGPLMPYRRVFLDYRLPESGVAGRTRYRIRDVWRRIPATSWKTPVRMARRARVRGRNVLASRGFVHWP